MAAQILSRWAVLSIGVVFHVIFLMSIFDIYFMSPLVHGMRHFESANPDPAQRLVLLVGDGLRADKFFEPQQYPGNTTAETLAPHLIHKIRTGRAMSGISHTRMPTESRPGHVALIAGFYEDVSAVTKGWQTNPVDFDSVFNQSTHTWSFGSPDILPMFAHGADPGRVDIDMYDASFEDFTRSSIDFDQYSFEHFAALLNDSKSNATLGEELHAAGNVFFLHLLGIDSAGHAKRPNSAEYYDNIKYIDGEIAKLEDLVRSYFGDDNTAFVFTADHGMSDLGSHGDGHPDNTRTPLVAWGKGVRSPALAEIARADVEQADIAMLMSFLLGINYPANGVGTLPVQYTSASPETRARALLANAEAVTEQYLVKENRVSQTHLRYAPFSNLSGNNSVAARRELIEHEISAGRYDAACVLAQELVRDGLRGLRYLQQYNWVLLRTLVTLGFLGFIAFAVTSFFSQFLAPEVMPRFSTFAGGIFALGFSVLVGIFKTQHSPLNYYLYAFFPFFFWYIVWSFRQTWRIAITRFLNGPEAQQLNVRLSDVLTVLGGLLLIEVLVCGFFHRELFSLLLVLVALPAPWVLSPRRAMENWFSSGLWSVSCLSLAFFGLCPVNKTENLKLIVYAGVLMVTISAVYAVYLSSVLWMSTVTMVTIGFQMSLILLSVIVTRVSVNSLSSGLGLPIGSQLIGWMTLLFSALVPFMHSLTPIRDYRFRLLNVFMMFSPAMVILSISYEGLFYVAFSLLMYSWVQLETLVFPQTKHVSMTTYRMAITFILFTHIAFFATGNIASISSFSLDSVYRLIPVFNPFSMAALLVFKILIPFVLLSVALGILNIKLGLPRFALFSMVLAISDVLSLNFFYLVVDEGSWLDIGTGISHFCICSMMSLFLSLIEYLSTALVSGVQL